MRGWMLGALLIMSACGDKDCDPSAAEICNNQDDNCDGSIDEGLPIQAYYADGDDDGYGTPFSSVDACAAPEGYAASDRDCDDTDSSINPAALEVCDGADNDCDGATDGDGGGLTDGVTGYLDEDGDGYGGEPGFSFCDLPSGFIDEGGDCDDFDASVTGGRTWYADADGDGYGDEDSAQESCEPPGDGYVSIAGDCDDAAGAVNPDATEICDDGVDNNCDGSAGDCAPLSGDVSISSASATLSGSSSYFGRWLSAADLDGDGRRELVTADVGISTGAAYVFEDIQSGDALGVSRAAGTITGSASGDAGYYSAAVDDLTGDGIADVLTMFEDGTIGLFDDATSGAQSTDDAALTLTGLSDVFDIEAGVLAAGDVNGDGAADLLVGEPEYDDTYSNEGRAFLVKGPLTDDVALTREPIRYGDSSTNAQLGFQVMDGGDTNGDGGHEVLLTARRSSAGGTSYAGAVYLVEGSGISGDTHVYDADTILLGSDSSGYFGQDAGAGGDVNGDGYDDLIVGAYGDGSAGMAYVFEGPLDDILGDHAADTTIYGSTSNGYLGWRVAMAGDLNDDGIDDIAFTELLSGYAVTSGGAVGVAMGPLSDTYTLSTADAVIVPTSAMYLGQDIAGVGDIDGDGVDDLAVGAYNAATVWLFFGGTGF